MPQVSQSSMVQVMSLYVYVTNNWLSVYHLADSLNISAGLQSTEAWPQMAGFTLKT